MIVWLYGVPTVGFGTLIGAIVSVVQVPAGPAVTFIDSRSLPTKVATMGDAEESVIVMIWRLFPLASLQLIAPVRVPPADIVRLFGMSIGATSANVYGAVPPVTVIVWLYTTPRC